MVGFNEMNGGQAEGAGLNRRLAVHRRLGHRSFKRIYHGAPTAWRIMVVKQNSMSMRAKARCIRARYRPSPPSAIRCVYASSKSPPLTAPVKLVIVTSCLHLPHQMLDSSSFLASGGTVAHSLAAGPVKLVIVTSCLHLPHQMLDSSSFLASGGTVAHSLAAGPVNLGVDSTFMKMSLAPSLLFDFAKLRERL